jgi:hypothetical protein
LVINELYKIETRDVALLLHSLHGFVHTAENGTELITGKAIIDTGLLIKDIIDRLPKNRTT